MRIYLSDTTINDSSRGLCHQFKYRTLFSYWYYQKKDVEADLLGVYPDKVFPEIMADSGAFSAFHSGAKFTVQQYGRWLLKWKHLFSWYVNLDVHYNVAESERNFTTLEEMGLKPTPVYHVYESEKRLAMLCERYPLVAIGGFAGLKEMKNNAMMRKWLRIFRIGERYNAVFHGFGTTNHRELSAFPFFSVDSTSWINGGKYGKVRFFDEKKGRFLDIRWSDSIAWGKYQRYLDDVGISIADLKDHVNFPKHMAAHALSVASYQRYERWLTERHGPVEMRCAR